MANELSWATLEASAGIAHYLANMLVPLLHDATDLRAVMTRRPFSPFMGSETSKFTQFEPDQTFAAASSEVSGGGSNVNWGPANFQLIHARRYMRTQLTQLWGAATRPGFFDAQVLIQNLSLFTGMTITDILVALFSALTGNTAVGSQTGDMSVTFMDDAMFALNLSRTPPPYAMVLHPKGHNEWFTSLSTLGGPRQYTAAAQENLTARGPGFKGTLGNVEVWDSDSVNQDTGSSYYRSAMFGRGCFSFSEVPGEALTPNIPPQHLVMVAGPIVIHRTWDADNGMALLVADYYPAVVEQEDARGVEIQHQVA